jgi:hypothetical protein
MGNEVSIKPAPTFIAKDIDISYHEVVSRTIEIEVQGKEQEIGCSYYTVAHTKANLNEGRLCDLIDELKKALEKLRQGVAAS